jgi:ATP-dependent Clp protease adaptor protein ClpS
MTWNTIMIMHANANPAEKEQEDVDVLEDVEEPVHLVVHNDEVNTFDWVIESLMEVCRHTYEQAEQSAMIIHFKGKYAVKTGPRNKLKPMKDALIERGIQATIEETG